MKALNNLIIKTLPMVPKPVVHIFAKKYIAGPFLEDAVRNTKELEAEGSMTTIDVLGEFVTKREQALHEKKEVSKVLDAIQEFNLPSYLSVKPTSLGMGIDFEFGYENIKELVDKAKKYGLFVRLDMENSPYTTMTLDMFKRFREEGYENVGIVIQAYMRRSEEDIRSVAEYKPNIRLCKGIYKEAIDIAYQDYEEVRANYRRLLKLIFDLDLYPGIATHDDALLEFAQEEIKARGLSKNQYEFQMLLGVKDNKRREIIAKGHRTRVYVPFGEDWYGYSTRRLKENPDMAGHIIKAIFKLN